MSSPLMIDLNENKNFKEENQIVEKENQLLRKLVLQDLESKIREINILKDDIQCLREDNQLLCQKLESEKRKNSLLISENQSLENKIMKSKRFSKDGSEAVKELLDILENKESFSIDSKSKDYIKIYNNSMPTFYIENKKNPYAEPGILTTLREKESRPDYNSIPEFDDWITFRRDGTLMRKQYDFKGKLISEVMNIFDYL